MTLEEVYEAICYEALTGCWLFPKSHLPNGYAYVRPAGAAQAEYVHRWMYTIHKGPIPQGLEIDHLCRTRCCCNPDHLEAVTKKVNTGRGYSPAGLNSRKTHCKYGHEFNAENSYTYPNGRYCKICQLQRNKITREKRKQVQI